MVRDTDGQFKDTVQNVRATGEFVVNIFGEVLAAQMNITSTEFPAGVDEFEAAGLTPAHSVTVRAPRVAESPMHYECQVAQIVELGHEPGAGCIVIGRVLHIHVADELLMGDDKIDISALQPIGRLAGNGYCRVAPAMFELARPASQIKRS